jgi:hypothetical protein
MDRVVLHDAFTPQGCAGKVGPVPAVSVGAGALWLHTYDAVTTQGGRYVQGGGCTAGRVAGLIRRRLGQLLKRYGMAASKPPRADVVTADAKSRTVNVHRPGSLLGAEGGAAGPSAW